MSVSALYVVGVGLAAIGLALIGITLVIVRLVGEVTIIRALMEQDFWGRDAARRHRGGGAGATKK